MCAVRSHTSAFVCSDVCNIVQEGLANTPDCNKWRKTLPRPKVGNSCSNGFKSGVRDACMGICEKREVVKNKLLQVACSGPKQEFPKPTMFKSCAAGYESGFARGKEATKAQIEVEHAQEGHQTGSSSPPSTQAPPSAQMQAQAPQRAQAQAKVPPSAQAQAPTQPQPPTKASAAAKTQLPQEAIATLPVTVDDKEVSLVLHQGQRVEDAVDKFCAVHMPNDAATCNEKLLPLVKTRLEASGIVAGV